ncbi:MAG: cytidine deaminase [Symbiobacteriia bacterium]
MKLDELSAADRDLVAGALAAREQAYTPYSQFRVGAALVTGSGRRFSGCNIENASYGLTNCAERTALFSAVAAGERDVLAIAVVADTENLTTPCGACRQVMVELAPGARVLIANMKGEVLVTTTRALLPGAFTSDELTQGQGR